MKKFFYLMTLVLACTLFTGCNSCQSDNAKQENENSVQNVAELIVENTISTDRQYMHVNYGDYRWYETCVLLKDFLDEECDGTISGISNIFQYIVSQDSTSADVAVVLSAYGDGKHVYEVKEGFWVGDSPMNDEEIKVTFNEAFERMMKTNYPKPHSRHCVLRKELGPVEGVAPQYVFGNTQAQLYVDAVTGEVNDENPAFKGFGKPLGEWP